MCRSLLIALVAVTGVAGCGVDHDGRRAPSPALDRQLIAAAYDSDVELARELIDDGADVALVAIR